MNSSPSCRLEEWSLHLYHRLPTYRAASHRILRADPVAQAAPWVLQAPWDIHAIHTIARTIGRWRQYRYVGELANPHEGDCVKPIRVKVHVRIHKPDMRVRFQVHLRWLKHVPPHHGLEPWFERELNGWVNWKGARHPSAHLTRGGVVQVQNHAKPEVARA